jgi:hypothetical protein
VAFHTLENAFQARRQEKRLSPASREVPTMFLFRWLNALQTPSSARRPVHLGLEQLEDRLTPATPTGFDTTQTTTTVQIIPNLFAGTVTEKVTATVTDQTNSGLTPQGSVDFNLNNQVQQNVSLDSSGKATATFNLPISALFTSQALNVSYSGQFFNAAGSIINGATGGSPTSAFIGSSFTSPLYFNRDNVLFNGTLTFGSPPSNSQLQNGQFYNTANGETDAVGPLTYQYSDPGTITSVKFGSLSLPGSTAPLFGAYGFLPDYILFTMGMSSSNSGSSSSSSGSGNGESSNGG